MDTVIIYKGFCYLMKSHYDVFFLRDNFKTDTTVEALIKSLKPFPMYSWLPKDVSRPIYKFENGKWYYFEKDFMIWECVSNYKPLPFLCDKDQHQLMSKLNKF